MAIVIGGHGLGLQDGSLGLLDRNDQTSNGTLDQRMQAFANVAGGNLVIQERDVFLPSRGDDFQLVRTYNSRGAIGGSADGWSYSTAITLSSHQDKPANNGPSVNAYVVTYGDGSVKHFDFSSGNVWVSTDGAGAYETLQVLNKPGADGIQYRLTRADQSVYNFDKDFVLVSMVDTNGVRTTFTYQGGRVQTVTDDTGHVITYQYDGIGKLAAIVDESGTRLVSYTYSGSQLSTVTDRFGHVTTYSYAGGLLSKISLPFQQTVNGQLQSFETREIQFTYQSINWDDHPHLSTPFDSGSQHALTSITDALGGVTTFENNFVFNTTAIQPGDRDLAYKQVGGRYFAGGTTRVVDATGNGLATSNAAEFQQKRVALGFAADVSALSAAQKEALRQQFSMSYAFDPDGYITQVTDQQGFKTTYTYGGKTAGEAQSAVNQDNLLSMTDRNGWGATTSDSAYFRALRKDLGYIDAAGNGRLVANLSAAEKTALLAKFTTTFTYDVRGNLLTSTDGLGNQTSYTYTAFNKLASMTAAMGNALATLDHLSGTDNFYRNKRVELGLPNVAASSLTNAQRTTLRGLYTTSYTYDAKQNLITLTDAGGDVTQFEYDAFGNLSKRTVVYRDAANVAVPAKNQVTTYAYDQFGNNVSVVDGESKTTTMTYDHFGNLLTMIDGRGGLTTFTYDADNRLLTVTDPEGLLTRYAYDAVGNRIAVTYANGHTVTQLFDKNNMLIETIDPAANAALTRNTTFKYDILGNRTEMTDAEGRTSKYTFDARRQLIDVATPQVLNGAEALVTYHSTFAYDGESNLVTSTDNNGSVTQALYSANGLLKRETDPIGNVTEFLYDANLMQVQITIGAQLAPALRRVLKFGRDEEDQVVSTTDPLNGIERQAYDAPGNVVSITDPNGNKTDFEYDRNNRLIKETKPAVTNPANPLQTIRYTVLHQYDANGNEVSTTDENGHVTTFAFDKDDRVVMMTDANGTKTVFSWDARANQTQIAIGVDAHLDASSHVVIDSVQQAAVTSFEYDEFNQLIATTDAVGNALASSDLPVYQSLRGELGFAALVASLSAADKTTLRNRFTERYEYDRVGNVTKATDHLGRVAATTYDALDRLQTHTEALGTTEERTTAFRYDGNGNLVKRTDPMGRTTRMTYDGNDRLVDMTDPLGVVRRHAYDDVGNMTSITDAFGTADVRTGTYIYDLNNRLIQETDPENHVKQYQYDAVGNRLKEIDARGGATQYVYDALNRNIRIIDPLSFQTRFEYDGAGNRITIVDANGGVERMQYDGANRYIQTTDPMGRVLRYEYDRLSNVIKQTTAFGLPEAEVTTYVYDAEGNLRSVTDAAGNVSTQRFDDVYNLTHVTDSNGHTTTTGFDALNRQIRVTDALGGTTLYAYDLEHNLLSETDPLGRTRTFQYDDRDQMITATDALGTLTTYAYDAVGNQVRITRAASTAEARTALFEYNKDNRLIRQTDPLGHATTFVYDANHNVVGTTDALGRVTTYTYDAANRVTQITDPLAHVTQYKYDGKGNRTQVIDARGNAMTAYYNLDDEVVLNVDAEGNAVANSYDGNGNRIRITEYMTPIAGAINPSVLPVPTASAADRITTYAYDKLNRLVGRTDALGGVFTMGYDAVGNKITETDENGHASTFAYDALDRLTSQTDPLGGTRSMTYDAVGNQLSITDENGHATSYVYDANDRLTRQTDPLLGTREFTYDAVGNQLGSTDENGHATTYAYDLDDRLIREANPLAGVKTYAYDAVNNRTQFTDENGHITTYAYDADDRLIAQTDPMGGVRMLTYDAVDNVSSMTDENGRVTTYTYDRINRLVAEKDPLNGVKSIVYDAVSNQILTTDENGQATRFEYDKNDRLIKRIDALNGERLFAYDDAGNQTGITDENGHATSYAYDANDRLIEQTDPLGGKRKFTYDAVGNELGMTDENGRVTVSVYDANDRLTQRTDPLLGVRTFAYDAVGNQLSMTDEMGRLTGYVYDALDRLTQQTDPLLGLRTFTYDAMGNQLSVTDENGHATSYVYDAKDRLIEQTDPLGGKRKFTYDAASNQLTATDENGDITSFVYDHNDRLIERIDALLGKQKLSYDAVGNQLTATDENGHTTTSVYDARDRLIEQTDALGGKRKFTYDAASNQLTAADENGHTIAFAYDANDRLIERTDGLGGARLFAYDAVGNQIGMTDENGHATSYTYDANDRLIRKLDALGGVRLLAYDAVGNQLTETDENGHITRYAYDANDRLTEVADPLGGKRLFTYDAVGNQLTDADELGRVIHSSYDANDRLIKQVDALGGERLIAYDAVGNQVSRTDENGHTVASVYDANDRLIEQTDPLAGLRTFTYDAVGNQLSAADQNGHVTRFEYDGNDRLIEQIDPLLGQRLFTYDGVGNRLTTTNENGHTTRFEYDANDRLTRETDPLGKVRLFAYDAVGNQASATDENGHTTHFEYDANDRLVLQTDPLGGERSFTYDAVGNRLGTTDENGHTASFAYDANDRLVLQTDPLGSERAYTYDAVGNQLTETDELGRIRASVYDDNNRLIEQTDPLGGTRSFAYDAVGNRLGMTDESGRATSFEYDANDRLVRQIDALDGERLFTYDAAGNQLTATDENGRATQFAYDANDRLIEQTDPLGGKRRFTYDAVGNALTATDANNHTTSFAYDGNNRITKQTDPSGEDRLFTYDGAGNRASMTDENGHATTYGYDGNNRLTEQTDPLGGKRRFTYDAAGNRLGVIDENNHATSFAYDANDRLVTETDALGRTRTMTYDAVGNQLGTTDENGHATSYTYDANDRLTRQTDALGQTRTHAYDAVGNRTSSTNEKGGQTAFTYDALNRQLTVTNALGGVQSRTYDAVGNQLGTTDENGHTTSFVYDANDRLITRTDALGNAQHSTYDAGGNLRSETDENGHTTTYTYDPSDRLIRTTNALGGVMTLTYDGVGNKVSETDENGDTTTYTYDKNNRKLTETDALGKTESCTYDAAGNRATETDKNGHTTTFTYDAIDRITRIVDPLGFATSMRYDAVGNMLETRQQLSLADPSQEQVFRYAYDALDRRVSSLSAEGFLTLFEYDAVGLLVKTTAFDNRFAPTPAGEAPLTGSGPGRIKLASYDAINRMVSETSPLGFVTRYEYDAVGNRTAMVEAHGMPEARRTEMDYDANDRLIEMEDALGVVTRLVLDAVGNTLEMHAAFGTPEARVTQSQYDAIDRVTRRTDPLGVVTEFAYDGVGNLLEQRRAVGLAEARTEHFEFDANRRMTAEINGEGERTEYAYDGVGNRTSLVVAKGLPEQRINRFRYDGDNRLVGETDGNGVETQYVYDGAGNKVKTIQLAAAYDSDGNSTGVYQGQSIAGLQRETLFAYDLDNRLIRVTNPMGGVTQYEVDALGNRTRITDVKGTQTVNTFDAGGRILTNWVQGGSHGGVLVTNRYDAFGNILQALRGFHDGTDTRQTTYTYDKRDRQTSITEYDKVDSLNAATIFSQTFSAVFEYDAFDNQTKVAQGLYLLSAGQPGYDAAKAARAHPLVAVFNFDAHDQLVSATDGVGNVLAYSNDAFGNRTSQTTGFGTLDARTVTFTYDRADRIASRRTGTGGVILLSYDEAGNQSEKRTLQSGSEGGSGADTPVWISEQFSYDGNGRVTRQTNGLGVATAHVLDAFGNEIATRFADGTAEERTFRAEFDANNNQTAEIDALGNRTGFAVDAIGNRIARTDALGYVTRLYYNELNQQIAVLDPEGYLTTFSRDSAGNVLQVKIYQQRYVAPADPEAAPAPAVADTPRVVTNEFDGSSNLIRKTEPDQRVKDFVYDSTGKLRQTIDHGSSLPAALALTADPAARVQSFEYDAAGRVVRFTEVDGVVEDYVYDTANNRTRETITNPNLLPGGVADPMRVTAFQYDADNRQTVQSFDPSGLDLTSSLAYDKAGNVVAKTDARGNVTRMTYDLANRMSTITDALNAVTQFGYDSVGNRTSATDALGHETRFEYDLNNRVTKVVLPAVDVFTIRNGLETNVHPTSATQYDAVGNAVQEIDADGFKSTAFFDGNRNRIAEINGDNVLRTFTYDANGLVTQASLYMARVDATAHDADTPPTPPAGEVRTISSEYDAAGRLIRTIYPSIVVTSLSGVNTSDPVASTTTVAPEETHEHNAFGERVESTDRNGNISFAYFDKRGRAVATVDSAGYLIETAYDDQGSAVQQRKYATALNLAFVSAGTRPAAPSGNAYTVDRTFDAANRLVAEQSPPIAVDGVAGQVRVTTRYAYDANGNLTSRTLAADSPEAASEYYYYDAANRQVAIVNDARVLHLTTYDLNGNKTSIKRFIDPVSGAITLAAATVSALLADVSPDGTRDQETTFTYDALNREARLTDVMGPGTADDITISSQYDARNNLTSRTDPEGFASQTAYDALGHITQTRSPDGNRSFVEYDAAGFKIKAWTGDLGANQATAATNVTATIGSALSVSWEVANSQLTSYLVYDTTPHDEPADYANESGQAGSGAVAMDVALEGLSAGSVLYFRVVTVDAAGSKAWTDEYSVTVPVLLSNLSVAQAGSDLEVTIRFNGTATNPQLLVGASTIAFVAQPDGSYKAIVTSPAQGGQGLSYQVRWTANGSTFTTAATPFEAAGEHQVIDATFTWPVPQPAQGDAQIVLLDGARQENAFQVNGQLQFTPVALANGDHVYHVLYGQSVAESHGFKLTNRDNQTTGAPSAPVDIKNANGDVIARSRTFTYQHNYTSQIEVTLDAAEATRAAATLQIAYRAAGNTGLGGFTTATVARTLNTFSAALPLAPGNYDIKVSYVHDGQEVIVQWRRVTVEATALHAPEVQIDNTDPFTFVGLPSSFSNPLSTTVLDLTDDESMTVVARETDGEITKLPSGDISVDPGLYTGPVDPGNAAFAVPLTITGSAAADKDEPLTGGTATYFTEIEYNALGTKIASNEDSGLWRRFDVDANGNTLVTRVYGTKADEAAGRPPIVAYSAYDARNLEIARFGAKAGVDANGDGIDETTARAVTRVTYDYEGRQLTELGATPGALAQTFEYDGVGNLTRQTDALGFATQMFYDRRGQEVRRVDARGATQRFVYDAAGRKIEEIDALNHTTTFGYDAFDRQITETDANGHASQMIWDQHDRLVQDTDANGNSTKYTYDKRDNRIWTEDANHHFFGHAYDAMGRVTNTYSFQSRTSAFLIQQVLIDAFNITPTPTTLAQAIDAVNDAGSPYRLALVNESIAYDIYGNKQSETDAEGRRRFFSYGVFGRLTKQTDESGRVTTFGYDRFGRLISEARPKDATVTGAKNVVRTFDDNNRLKSITDNTTKVSTTYTYGVAGSRMHETVTAPNFPPIPLVTTARNLTYGYDGLGRMVSWSDSITGKTLTYAFDAVGNQVRVSGSDGTDHRYTFDLNNRVTQITQGLSTLKAAYTYDAAGNRKTFNDGSTTATYTYDAADRATRADITPNATPGFVLDDTHMTWQYDAVGNVTQYRELSPLLTPLFTQTNRYTANNRTQQTSTNDQRDPDAKSIISTLNQLDKTGRVLIEGRTDSTDPDDVQTTTYTHRYAKDGRELSVTATGTGDKTGNTTSTFDANDRLVKLDLGQGDAQDSKEFKLFIYNNDGQILRRYHDDGEDDTTTIPVTQFLYANGNPVGETGTKNDGTTETVLDSGNYGLIKNLGEEFPKSSVSEYIVRAGDTLQSIAAQLYGNPSLWFLIADANGLTGSEQLKAGTRLSIPNSTEMGRITADTHKVYDESEIVGSTLPNLKSPSPSGAAAICAIIGAIILAILIAIVAIVITIVTAGTATPAAAALLGVGESAVATMIVGVAIGAVVGTVVAVAASAITQGIFIGFGLQKEFDWKQFAGDIAGGILGGIGGAISGTAQVLTKVANLATNVARLARVAAVGVDVALQVAGEAVSQAVRHDGRIEEPWMLGVAAGAAIAGEVILGAIMSRGLRNAITGRITGDAPTPAAANVGQPGTASKAPVKNVTFADKAEVFIDRPPTGIGKADDTGIAASLKNVDTKLGDASAGDRTSLELKNPGASLSANDNTASMKPLTLDDNASSTLSVVQSPIALDKGVDLESTLAAKKMISGETASFEQKSVVDFDEGAVGKVADNKVPIETVAVQQKPDLTPDQKTRAERLETLVKTREEQLRFNEPHLPDYNKVAKRPLAATKLDLPDDEANSAIQKFKRVFDYEVVGFDANRSRLSVTDEDLRVKVTALKESDNPNDRLLGAKLEQTLAKKDLDTHSLYALQGYTDAKRSGNKDALALAKKGDVAYEYVGMPGKEVKQDAFSIEDFNVLNRIQRGITVEPQSAKEVTDAFESYVSLVTRGLNQMPEHKGLVVRGADFDDATFNKLFQKGGTFKDKAFMSTSHSPSGGFEKNTELVINSRGGGRRIEGISLKTRESEALFAPGARFKVLDVEVVKIPYGDTERTVRRVYLDELPAQVRAVRRTRVDQPDVDVPRIRTTDDAQVVQPQPIKSGQDVVPEKTPPPDFLIPTKPGREGDDLIPLSARAKVDQSTIDVRIDPTKNKKLNSYAERGLTPFASTPEGRAQQLAGLDTQLGKAKSGLFVNAQAKQQARNESKLIDDTINDKSIMSSPYVSSPAHALELKRLGLQPSAAGRVGQFNDVHLDGNMKTLGSGAFNTVYVGKYTMPDKTTFEGVFKPEVRNWDSGAPDAAGLLGISGSDVRAGYRNVATTRLDETLGFGGLTTRSEMAIHNQKLGTVSERAGGVSYKGGKIISDEPVPEWRIKEFTGTKQLTDAEFVARWNASDDYGMKPIGLKVVDGQQRLFYKADTFHDVNFNDATLRRDLVRLQLMDSIAGQVDRHAGNYFVKQSMDGKVLRVQGIDNDLSWGAKFKLVEGQYSGASHLPGYFPPVVDKQAFDSIMSLKPSALSDRMGGLLTKAEIDAAGERLSVVQNHLRKLSADNRVLSKLDDWSSPDVTRLLTAEKDNMFNSYVGRDIAHKEFAKASVVPYPTLK